MDLVKFALIVSVSIVAISCRTTSFTDLPALLVEPTEDSRSELLLAVRTSLNGTEVNIADDALTQVSLLTIERAPPRDLQNNPLTGRTLSAPHQFRLVVNGPNCVLINLADGGRWRLLRNRCMPE